MERTAARGRPGGGLIRAVRKQKGKPVAPDGTPPRRRRRRVVESVLVAVGFTVLLDALFGERGLVELLRAKEQSRTLESSVETLRETNERLREEVRRLNDDPATIEDEARRRLGLIKPGERVFTVRDVPAPK